LSFSRELQLPVNSVGGVHPLGQTRAFVAVDVVAVVVGGAADDDDEEDDVRGLAFSKPSLHFLFNNLYIVNTKLTATNNITKLTNNFARFIIYIYIPIDKYILLDAVLNNSYLVN
jgi:hypothetical protein